MPNSWVSQDLLRAAVESANDAIIITEPEINTPGPRIQYVNPAFERMTGWTAEEAIGRTPRMLQGPKTSKALLKRLRHNLEQQEDFHGETINYRKDQTEYHVEWLITAIRNSEGAIQHWVAVQRDVTERARQQDEIRRAKEQAEAANRAKDEFLATLSHELRTPLTAILGYASLIKSGHVHDIESAAEVIERSALSQAHLIDDILDVSRIIMGKLTLNITHINVGDVARSALAAVTHSASAKGIRLTTDIGERLRLNGDVARLQQVIWNLLNNAVKFTPAGGDVKLVVQRSVGVIEITVSDTGLGIEKSFLAHVFDRFKQSDASTTRSFGGLGLGLSIVRHIVEMHGGTVSVSSAGPNQGSTFKVELPLNITITADGENGYVERNMIGDESKIINLTGTNVLVIDDQIETRHTIEKMIGVSGASVHSIGSAVEGLNILKQKHEYDVVVSDIGMPVTDGYTFCKLLREDERNASIKRTPTLALTAYAQREDRDRAIAAGFDDHIPKPPQVVTLVSAIARLVGKDLDRSDRTDPVK